MFFNLFGVKNEKLICKLDKGEKELGTQNCKTFT